MFGYNCSMYLWGRTPTVSGVARILVCQHSTVVNLACSTPVFFCYLIVEASMNVPFHYAGVVFPR